MSKKTCIHLVYESKRKGEENQAKGIMQAFQALQGGLIEIKVWDNFNFDQPLDEKFIRIFTGPSENPSSEEVTEEIVIAINEYGLKALQATPFSVKNFKLTTVFACHQPPKELFVLDSLQRIDILQLPTHMVSRTVTSTYRELLKKSGTQLVTTPGVAHTMTREKIKAAFEKWPEVAKLQSQKPIPLASHYIVVSLGGNVPGFSGHFTAQEGKSLAQYLADLQKNDTQACILITDSPRTDSETRNAVLEELKTQKTDFQFFPFTPSNVPNAESAFPAILGATIQNEQCEAQSKVFITGDSDSMCCEARDSIKKIQTTKWGKINTKPIYIIKVGSMNSGNLDHVEFLKASGDAHVLEFSSVLEKRYYQRDAAAFQQAEEKTAAQRVAESIQQRIVKGKKRGVETLFPKKPLSTITCTVVGVAVAVVAWGIFNRYLPGTSPQPSSSNSLTPGLPSTSTTKGYLG